MYQGTNSLRGEFVSGAAPQEFAPNHWLNIHSLERWPDPVSEHSASGPTWGSLFPTGQKKPPRPGFCLDPEHWFVYCKFCISRLASQPPHCPQALLSVCCGWNEPWSDLFALRNNQDHELFRVRRKPMTFLAFAWGFSLALSAREGDSLTVSLYTLASQSRKKREETSTRSSAGTWIPGAVRDAGVIDLAYVRGKP